MIKIDINDFYKYSLHIFTEKEYEADRKFRDKHYKKCDNGNRYVYELVGTGIGTIVKISCPVCGKMKDITDTDNW